MTLSLLVGSRVCKACHDMDLGASSLLSLVVALTVQTSSGQSNLCVFTWLQYTTLDYSESIPLKS